MRSVVLNLRVEVRGVDKRIAKAVVLLRTLAERIGTNVEIDAIALPAEDVPVFLDEDVRPSSAYRS